jgi:hypothetical protein
VTSLATVALRLAGTALLVVSAVLLAPTLGLPSLAIVVAGPLVGAGVISLHNARVASRR